MSDSIATQLLTIELRLASELGMISYGKPVCYIYNPIEYAFDLHSVFVNRFCTSRKKILFLGMNPGPWGMAQTGGLTEKNNKSALFAYVLKIAVHANGAGVGPALSATMPSILDPDPNQVPFGEVNAVREWLKVEGMVKKPQLEHPKRPVLGLACHRSEVSGKRFWALFRDISGQPETFFRNAFVYNHCPVAFLAESGNNITVPELKLAERKRMTFLCDQALGEVLDLLSTEVVVAVGKFAEQRAKHVVATSGLACRICIIAHPSPRNCGVKDWPATVTKQLTEFGLMPYLQPG